MTNRVTVFFNSAKSLPFNLNQYATVYKNSLIVKVPNTNCVASYVYLQVITLIYPVCLSTREDFNIKCSRVTTQGKHFA